MRRKQTGKPAAGEAKRRPRMPPINSAYEYLGKRHICDKVQMHRKQVGEAEAQPVLDENDNPVRCCAPSWKPESDGHTESEHRPCCREGKLMFDPVPLLVAPGDRDPGVTAAERQLIMNMYAKYGAAHCASWLRRFAAWPPRDSHIQATTVTVYFGMHSASTSSSIFLFEPDRSNQCSKIGERHAHRSASSWIA